MRIIIIIIILIFNCITGYSQSKFVSGKVLDSIDNNHIYFANIYYYIDSAIYGTSTDSLGNFSLEIKKDSLQLITQSIGYFNDTTYLNQNYKTKILIKLKPLYTAPPEYYFIQKQDTVFYNYYDDNNNYVYFSIGSGTRYCNGEPCNGEIITYYINNNICEIATYKNGLPYNGEYKDYYENGKIASKGQYLNYNRIAQWIFLNENNLIEAIINYDSIERIISEYWFYENGNLNDHSHFINDSACIKNSESYYDSGELESRYFQPNCETDSVIWFEYYRNGRIKSKKIYKDNLKHGNFEYYDINGNLIKTEYYKLNKLINTAANTQL